MTTLANSPAEFLVLELDQAKSFAFTLQFEDTHGNPIDLTSTRSVFTMGSYGGPGEPPTVLLEVEGLVTDPTSGRALVALQAADLDLPEAAYPFVVVLRVQGYSTVLIKGEVSIQPNIERASTAFSYSPAASAHTLRATLQRRKVVRIVVQNAGHLFGGGGAGLDAFGQPAGLVPTADGADGWSWALPADPTPERVATRLVGDTVELAPSARLLAVTMSAGARVRLYRSAEQRAADLLRPFASRPQGDVVLADWLLPAAGTLWANPVVDVAREPGDVYYFTIGGTGVDVDLTWEATA